MSMPLTPWKSEPCDKAFRIAQEASRIAQESFRKVQEGELHLQEGELEYFKQWADFISVHFNRATNVAGDEYHKIRSEAYRRMDEELSFLPPHDELGVRIREHFTKVFGPPKI
jgi:hypothetical protein